MDFHRFLRGFFGFGVPPNREIPQSHPFDQNDKLEDNEDIRNSSSHPNFPDENQAFGFPQRPSMVFGDLMSEVEHMFKEMERSVHEMESFFTDGLDKTPDLGFRLENFDLGADETPPIPTLPPPSKDADANLRDLVLKPSEDKKKNKILPRKKADEDLDELYADSKLPLSEFPILPKRSSAEDDQQGISSNSQFPGFHSSTFERTYSTYSFKNGKWEGQTVRENNEGKEITTYERNESGDIVENRKFISKSEIQDSTAAENQIKPFRPFGSILDSFFRPRL